jgi:hypothetical protein
VVIYKNIFPAIALLFMASCSHEEHFPSTSARRYLDMSEISRAMPKLMDPRADLVTTRYLLIERQEVQADLQLSSNQLRDAQNAFSASADQIPGLNDFVADQKAREEGLPPDARKAHIAETNRGVSRILNDFERKKLSELLLEKQRNRLDQLVIQVHGPVLIVIDDNLATQLGVDSRQMEQIKSLLRKTDRDILPLLQRFGRGFIAGFSPSETEESRQCEQADIIARLPEMISKRDRAILQILTDDQQKKFCDLQGPSLQIAWNPWNILQVPFNKESCFQKP